MTREELQPLIDEINEKMKQIMARYDLQKIETEIESLQNEMAEPNFYNDAKRASTVGKRLRKNEDLLSDLKRFDKQVKDLNDLLDTITDIEYNEMQADISQEADAILQELRELWVSALLSGKYDACNAILTVHSGAGGTEATDWADMLFRMYKRYCERHDFTFNIIDVQEGDTTGVKSATIEVDGDNAYGYLKCEKGVHRLVRISPFDSNARRHTSFASVEVIPVIESEEVEIKDEDLKIDTYRASGAGGQHVNKTDSAVRIKHIPTGIVVQCQNERSQIQNKATAMKILLAKLAELKEQEEQKKMADIQGQLKKIEWGSQIRSYVFHPYTMVKDHRTGYETADINSVMDGDIQEFINAYLIKANTKAN